MTRPNEPPATAGAAAAHATARILGGHDTDLLIQAEDAGLNASAPPQQRWMDGWLVRTNPGKAQRARCINAVAPGRRPVTDKLQSCEDLFRRQGLPLLVRITPFTQPPELDAWLAGLGYGFHDETRVMVLPALQRAAAVDDRPCPAPGGRWEELDADRYAEIVGAMRGSSPEARHAHAERVRHAPVPYRGFVLRAANQEPLACGQIACEGTLVGLYDVATARAHQGHGYATWLCRRLLTLAISESACTSAYLQVGADNHSARRIYTRLGFEDAYSYHYRLAP